MAPRRHRFRPIDFLVPGVVAVVLLCLALFWAPKAGTDWTPFRGSVGGAQYVEAGLATPAVLGEG